MATKKIKNNTGSAKTWCGQEIAASAYYTIQASEEGRWANDSTLLTAIGNGEAVVANATADITDISLAINYLKDVPSQDTDGIPMIRLKPLGNADGFLFRGTGFSGTAAKTTSTNIDFKMPATMFINGVNLMAKNQVWGDFVDFKVVDKDNILGYGAGTVLNQFAYSWFLEEDSQGQNLILIPYPAKVLKDLYIRIAYTSVGATNDVLVQCNLFLHKKA